VGKIEHIGDLKPDRRNARKHNPRNIGMIASALQEVGAARSIVIDEDGNILAGNGTIEAAAQVGITRLQVVEADGETIVAVRRSGLTTEAKQRLALYDNRTAELADWDTDVLAGLRDEDGALAGMFYDGELDALLADAEGDSTTEEQARQTLAERFIVPPFSVLDARQGYWQERKRAWLALGIQGEIPASTLGEPVGRERGLVGGSGWDGSWVKKTLGEDYKGLASNSSGTSTFDPVLCELVCRWFCPPTGVVLDPFAGGSVRGIVAARVGLHYAGVDLRPEQVEANREQARTIVPDSQPTWVVGDSRDIREIAAGEYDLIFSCPPYADLEVYSDDPRDLSTLRYEDFIREYRHIIADSVAMLKPDRFACFVVGDVRDPKGLYRNFVSDTIQAFHDAGARLYNEAILVTSVGSLPIRVGKQFSSGRKLGKTHQNVLVFVKGDPRKAVQACGPVEVSVPDEAEINGA
jgi:hypothetical protein